MTVSREEFDTLVAQTGLPLSAEQKDGLFAAYPLFQALVATFNTPLPREAEPALTFAPEVKG